MKKRPRSFLYLLFVLGILLPGRLAASVEYDAKIPQLVFAAQELNDALKEAGRENLQVALIVKPDEALSEAFQIQSVGPNQIRIIGTDATGAMYGGLEVADLIRLGLPIDNQERAPFVKKRGIKFNIPLDARTPSYDDTGDSAQNNIETVWDFDFWKAYLDDLARYRYNVLSLWTTHPFPSIIKIEEYPEVVLDDVYRIGVDIYPHYKNKWQDVDFDKPSSVFTGNVINYDFLPTFVDWAGGDSKKLQNIDGVSLADYMAGKEPDRAFLNRYLYFHYPHYRRSVPHSVIISGSSKVIHFYERPDIPMLFDLSGDIGEVTNIAKQNSETHQKLYDGMMSYFEQVGARFPKINPDYDPEVYKSDKKTRERIQWGPFEGQRTLDYDEI